MVTDDPELVDFVRRRLQTDDVDILETTFAQEIKEAYRHILVRLPSKLDLLRSQLLVATGRAANSESLELSRAGITWDAKGIEVSAG